MDAGSNVRHKQNLVGTLMHQLAHMGSAMLVRTGLDFRDVGLCVRMPIASHQYYIRLWLPDRQLADLRLLTLVRPYPNPTDPPPRYKQVRKAIRLGAKEDVNARDTYHLQKGETPLYRAAQAGHDQVLRDLVEAGADVDATDDVQGRTAICTGALHGRRLCRQPN